MEASHASRTDDHADGEATGNAETAGQRSAHGSARRDASTDRSSRGPRPGESGDCRGAWCNPGKRRSMAVSVCESGLEGITKDLPRAGRKPTKRAKVEGRIIRMTTQTEPANATHWSTRTLADQLGVSQSMVHRVWKANGLKPHLVKTFKVSNDPRFEEKLRDVVGLYLNPPENALVFSADEKTSIQALDRTQPSLPLVKGRCDTMTHDYKRNGTTTLFAAIELGQGEVIATCMKRHRHQEWLKFLRMIDERNARSTSTSISSSTTMPRTSTRRSSGGSNAIPDSTCTSSRRAARG